MSLPSKAVIVTGPTASGKTRLAVALARHFHGEIISVDSRQVYRGMDLGTGKDLSEYQIDGQSVPVHLMDVVEPHEDFHLFRYLQLASEALVTIADRGHLPIVTGGSVLYLKALLEGYHHRDGGEPNQQLRAELADWPLPKLVEKLRQEAAPELFQRTDLTQPRRVIRALELARTPSAAAAAPMLKPTLILAPYYPRAEIRERIEKRLLERFEQGMIKEVQELQHQGVSWEKLEWFGLEYRMIARFLQGEYTQTQMQELLLNKIRQFAKGQDIWFRKLERNGHVIYWLPQGNQNEAIKLTEDWLAGKNLPPPKIRLDDIRYG